MSKHVWIKHRRLDGGYHRIGCLTYKLWNKDTPSMGLGISIGISLKSTKDTFDSTKALQLANDRMLIAITPKHEFPSKDFLTYEIARYIATTRQMDYYIRHYFPVLVFGGGSPQNMEDYIIALAHNIYSELNPNAR